jgi:hypothetical protein
MQSDLKSEKYKYSSNTMKMALLAIVFAAFAGFAYSTVCTPTGCSSFVCNSTGTYCSACDSGYTLSAGVCSNNTNTNTGTISCGSNCATCDSTGYLCGSCNSGYTLYSNGACQPGNENNETGLLIVEIIVPIIGVLIIAIIVCCIYQARKRTRRAIINFEQGKNIQGQPVDYSQQQPVVYGQQQS